MTYQHSFFSTGKPAELFDSENLDWAPTQHLGHDFLVKASSSDEKAIAEKNKARYERHRERNIKRQILEELNETKEAESGGIDDSFLVVAEKIAPSHATIIVSMIHNPAFK